jgi:hypothetical protein
MKHLLKSGLALAAIVCMTQSAMVMADEGPYATFNIKVENNPTISDVSPALTQPITKDKVAFRIENHTGRALYFEDNDKEYIPVVSNDTVTAPYAPGKEYKLVDADGNTVATWTLGGKTYQANAASATAEQFAAWSQSLQTVIANQKVTYQEPPAKMEPNYNETHTIRSTSSGDVVRGYW